MYTSESLLTLFFCTCSLTEEIMPLTLSHLFGCRPGKRKRKRKYKNLAQHPIQTLASIGCGDGVINEEQWKLNKDDKSCQIPEISDEPTLTTSSSNITSLIAEYKKSELAEKSVETEKPSFQALVAEEEESMKRKESELKRAQEEAQKEASLAKSNPQTTTDSCRVRSHGTPQSLF